MFASSSSCGVRRSQLRGDRLFRVRGRGRVPVAAVAAMVAFIERSWLAHDPVARGTTGGRSVAIRDRMVTNVAGLPLARMNVNINSSTLMTLIYLHFQIYGAQRTCLGAAHPRRGHTRASHLHGWHRKYNLI